MIHATSSPRVAYGVRVRAAGLRNHRGEFRIAEPRERAAGAEQHERENERRPRADANHLAVRPDLAGRRRSDRSENAGADHGADREHDQIAGTEHARERVRRRIACNGRLADGLDAENAHRAGGGASGRRSTSSRHTASSDASTRPPSGSNASPTSRGRHHDKFGRRIGPADVDAIETRRAGERVDDVQVPRRSNASPCGRPNPSQSVSTSRSGVMR